MRIRQLRLEREISQSQISRMLGVAQASVSAWENGRAKPSADMLPRIAKALHCTIDELFDKEATENVT